MTPLPVKRAEIRIDKIGEAFNQDVEIVTKEIEILRTEIVHLPKNSIVIRDAKNELDKFSDDFWNNLDEEKTAFLHNKIESLFKTVVGVDFKAMCFEKDVLLASLYRLKADNNAYDKQTQKLMEQIAELPLSISIVAKHQAIIEEALKLKFWQNATDEKLDGIAEELAQLMQCREIYGEEQTRYNLENIIKEKEFVSSGAENESVRISEYKKMMEVKITELLVQNVILQKIKDGKNITQEKAKQLSELLANESPHITIDLLRRVYHTPKVPFLKLICLILGIEKIESFPDTVSVSIDQFIVEHTTLTITQLEFLNLLRDFIIKQGDREKKDLISVPFTVLHPDDIRGVFTPNEIEEILILTKELVA